MEGDAAQQAEYLRQHEEALVSQKGLVDEALQAAGEQPATAAPTGDPAGEPGERPEAPAVVKKGVVFGGVLNGKAVSKPEPEYPAEAKAAGAQGIVTVRVLVDEEGLVAEAEAISGHPLLREAAVAAARNSRYSPTRLSGQPVKVSGVVTYNFVLE
jgi:periplasmic protein TonB